VDGKRNRARISVQADPSIPITGNWRKEKRETEGKNYSVAYGSNRAIINTDSLYMAKKKAIKMWHVPVSKTMFVLVNEEK
jgi:hypothetical protein